MRSRFREPYVTARGTLERREMVLLRLTHRQWRRRPGGGRAAVPAWRRDAVAGRAVAASPGEASGAARNRGDDRGGAAGRRRRRGDRRGRRAAAARAGQGGGGRRPSSTSPRRMSGTPLWRMLRGESAPPLRCNATLGAGSPSELAAEAARWKERGFETFKLKLGIGDDAERARAVRDAVGPDARLRVDANGAWSADRAVAVLERDRAARDRAGRAARGDRSRRWPRLPRRPRSRSPPTRA